MRVETRELVPTPIESVPTQERPLVQEKPEGLAKTIQFIETALAQGAHFRVPKRFSKERWDRNLDITLVYLLSPDESLEDTGKAFGGLSRERVKKIRNKTMGTLWLNSSRKTRSRFPLEELELNKLRPQKTKEITVFSRDHIESKSPHQNPEKREFVILAEGGQKWKTLTDKQRLVLAERHLADHPDALRTLARKLEIPYQSVAQIEAAGLRKLGFFGEPISFTRQQLQDIFQNAKEKDIKRLTPKERELLKRLYGGNINIQRSQPTIHTVAADIKVYINVADRGHQSAMQKLLHTKRTIQIDQSLSPTPKQVEFMRQKSPEKGTRRIAKEMGKSPDIVLRWQKQEGIQPRQPRIGRPPISPPPEVLEFIKNNYPRQRSVALGKQTGYDPHIIIQWLREAGTPIGKRGRQQKITS